MSTLPFQGKVLVAGATGRTGLWVVRRLLHYGISLRAFARRADKLAEFNNIDGDGTIRLIDAAADAGVQHFILISSIAATKPFHPLNLFGGVLSQKRRAEQHLEKVFSNSGRTFTIIRPGGLKDGEPLRHKLQLDVGDKISGLIDRSDVAELAVLSLWHPKAKNNTFEAIRLNEEAQSPTDFL
jgi:nucleoside-diphosphate-sugar epimerase